MIKLAKYALTKWNKMGRSHTFSALMDGKETI